MAAYVGGTTNAGAFTMPWEQPRGPNPAFACQVVAYPTHERPGTIIVDPANHFLYFIHDAGQAIRPSRRAAQKTKTCARGSICGPMRSSG
jgi:lipoprotein-anchoring transpeptidase ErfK/SrfK